MRLLGHLTILAIFISCTRCFLRDFDVCQDDFDLKPKDGILKDHTFTWLGFLQYLHITTGLPHHSKAPRVVLVHRQFVVGTAMDLLVLPRHYKLANVIFGDYERDEIECNLTHTQVRKGQVCPRAYLEIPTVEIAAHPEYTRFGIGNSIALAKLLRAIESAYMVPICLPNLAERRRKKQKRFVYMIDYINSLCPEVDQKTSPSGHADVQKETRRHCLLDMPMSKRRPEDVYFWTRVAVPKEFEVEKLGKKTLKMFTHQECRQHRMRSKLGSAGVTHVLCSSGCGVRPGSPLISHSYEGTFQLLGIAVGGAPCERRAMRNRLNPEPPLYIDVYPYTTWIVNYITAQVLPRPYPDHFALAASGTRMGINKAFLHARRKQQYGWRGRTFLVGNHCFRSNSKQQTATLFYSERFRLFGRKASQLNVVMEISAGIEITIMCARLLLPNRLVDPRVEGVGGYNITLVLNTLWFPTSYDFGVGLYGMNTTKDNLEMWALERSPNIY